MDAGKLRLTGAMAVAIAVLMAGAGSLWAQEDATDLQEDTAEAVADVVEGGVAKGAVTNLPLPRFVSLKTGDGNVRRGPSLEHRIDWVFRHRGMPLLLTAEFEHWRRVEDSEGQGGWIYYTLLSGVRTVLVMVDKTALHAQADKEAQVVAIADEGVIADLGTCLADWCEISVGRSRGWVEKTALWGVDQDEIRE
ncbi:MAG: SH3 domain-containing protein [Albidovulum sp.]|uniref:SH3 domain-containing protein n=1 Tax=Albidovulum sp. TaxID=1872424 RepID=UPI003CAFFEA1